MKTTNVEKLESFFGEIYRKQIHGESSVNDFINWYEHEEEDLSFEWLTDYLREQQGFFEIEVIYYRNAIEYLSENDCSLTECLEIAGEFGYTLENLNSEILASLLKSRNFKEEWNGLAYDIENFFDKLKTE